MPLLSKSSGGTPMTRLSLLSARRWLMASHSSVINTRLAQAPTASGRRSSRENVSLTPFIREGAGEASVALCREICSL